MHTKNYQNITPSDSYCSNKGCFKLGGRSPKPNIQEYVTKSSALSTKNTTLKMIFICQSLIKNSTRLTKLGNTSAINFHIQLKYVKCEKKQIIIHQM